MLRPLLPLDTLVAESRQGDDDLSAFRGDDHRAASAAPDLQALQHRRQIGAMAALLAVLAAAATTLPHATALPLVAALVGLLALMCALVSALAGVVAAAAGVAALVALVLLDPSGGAAAAALPRDVASLARSIALPAAVIVIGLACGLVIARLTARSLRSGSERERRFAGLLAIAADSYWEMDAGFAICHLSHRQHDGRFVAEHDPWGRPPWEVPDLLFDDDVLDVHRADLEGRRPFRELPVRFRDRRGRERHLRVSGEPRFDARGAFVGYWGVTRNVTAEVRTHRALHATETRYRELFTRLPTALVLHRRGRIVDANDAAAALFGYANVVAMTGRSMELHYDDDPTATPDATADIRERMAQLDALPAGASLPPTPVRLSALDGTRLSVLATGVRLDTEHGTATLSIYLDETDRLLAEEAVRRSEALLSHLVATSPDLITLTDTQSGRYVMVNDAFERLTGYHREEIVGRTSTEIGIWHDTRDREEFVADLRRQGVVRDRPLNFVGKSGRPLLLLVSAAQFSMDGHSYMVLTGRDITGAERERLERAAILEHASIGIAMTRDRRIHVINSACEQMLGWPHGALVGLPSRAMWPSDEAHEAIDRDYGPALARGERVEIETLLARRDGSTFTCRLLACAVDPSRPAHGGTIWIAEDVTEQRRLGQALASARDAAEAANRAKSTFLANTSHEIRTPLNGLVGLARLARQPDVSEMQRRHYLDQIADSAQTLSAIISDILDLSKIEAGKLHIELVPFDLHAMLHTIGRGYGALADARGITLSLQIDADVPPAVLGDPVRVRQILSNYMSNALKFTPEGQVRLVAARRTGDLLRFEVHDTGPGIDEATQARLFSPFTQADESTTRRYGGTGLGLSICRELAHLMGGQVGVRSTVGAGSEFWVELALPALREGPPEPGIEPADVNPLAGLRVLMVEDNPVNMLIAVALLEQWGVDVGQVENGRQAIEAVDQANARGRPWDVVLMDVQMPVMGGHEATRILRRRFDRDRLPIVALTAAALVSERDDALAIGMNDFITKPIDAQRLRTVLEQLSRRQRG